MAIHYGDSSSMAPSMIKGKLSGGYRGIMYVDGKLVSAKTDLFQIDKGGYRAIRWLLLETSTKDAFLDFFFYDLKVTRSPDGLIVSNMQAEFRKMQIKKDLLDRGFASNSLDHLLLALPTSYNPIFRKCSRMVNQPEYQEYLRRLSQLPMNEILHELDRYRL